MNSAESLINILTSNSLIFWLQFLFSVIMKLSGYRIQAGAFTEFSRLHIMNQSCSTWLKKSMDQPKPKMFPPVIFLSRLEMKIQAHVFYYLAHMNPLFVGCGLLRSLHLRFLVGFTICRIRSKNSIPSVIMKTLLGGEVNAFWACPCT